MGGPRTDQSGRIQKSNGQGGQNLAQILTGPRFKQQLAAALPRHVTADRMARVALTAVRTVPRLAECDQVSFMSSLMQAAQLGLEPSTPLGHAYLIPFKNKKKGIVECNLIIGYQGYLDLARRSGKVTGIYAYAVREGDEFHYELGLQPTVKHVPSGDAGREERPITHVYAVAKLKEGEPLFEVLTRAQVEQRRKRSKAANDGPWVTDYESMCLKTAIRALWRWLPKSIEMARADELDGASERGVPITATLDDEQLHQLGKAGVHVQPEDAQAPEAVDSETGEVQEAQPAEAPVIRWGEAKGTPLRYADDDRLASYMDEVDAEIQQHEGGEEPADLLGHFRAVNAERDRRAQEGQS